MKKKQTLEERLKIYVSEEGSKENSSNKLLLAASAAASVGAILIPPPAEAAIVYSLVQNKVVSTGQGSQTVDFDEDGNPEFIFSLYFIPATSPNALSQTIRGAVSASVIRTTTTTGSDPRRLGSNYTISNKNLFFSQASYDNLAANNTSAPGDFLNAQGFLGVQFKVDSGTHYGWIQYKANSDASVATIIDWAYEDIPGKAIKTPRKFNWNLFLPAITAGNKK